MAFIVTVLPVADVLTLVPPAISIVPVLVTALVLPESDVNVTDVTPLLLTEVGRVYVFKLCPVT